MTLGTGVGGILGVDRDPGEDIPAKPYLSLFIMCVKGVRGMYESVCMCAAHVWSTCLCMPVQSLEENIRHSALSFLEAGSFCEHGTGFLLARPASHSNPCVS